MLMSCITRPSWFHLDTLNNKPQAGSGGGGGRARRKSLR